jgi:hypothetical protein
MENQHIQTIPIKIQAEVQKKIGEITAMLKPYMLNLTPEERQVRLKLGYKNLAFVEKSHDYARANSAFVPSYMDMEMFCIDAQDANGMHVLSLSLQQLLQVLDDIVMVSGSEAYNQALMFYNAVKQAAQEEIPEAKAIYEDLKTCFPDRPIKKIDNEFFF